MNQWIRRAAWLALALILALTPTLASAAAQDDSSPQDRLDALVTRMREATDTFFKEKWKGDLTDEQREALYATRPGPEFIPEFEALAVEAKGTDVAASARLQVFSLQCDFQKQEDAAKTLERLLTESIDSKSLKDLPTTVMYSYAEFVGKPAAKGALERLLTNSPHKEVQASALFTLGQMHCGRKATDEEKAQGRKYFERLIAEYPEVKSRRSTYKTAAEAFLFELDHLQIGMQAPDFETIDENGTKFKLSDYRGKVVVIDFWGNW